MQEVKLNDLSRIAISELEVGHDRPLVEAQEAVNKQAERDHLMGAIALRIHQSLDLDEILSCTVAEVRQFLEVDRVLVYHFTSIETGTLVAADFASQWNLDGGLDCHKTWYCDSQAVYKNDQSYIVPMIESQGLPPDYLSFMRLLEVRAKIAMPITVGGCFWGVLVLHQCCAPRQWQRFETDFLEQLTTQLAIAIQQAQLFSQVQQQAQREQLLNRIGRALNSSLDLSCILQEIVDRTGECFQVDRVVMYTLTGEIQAQHEWRINEQVGSLLHLRAPLSDWPDVGDRNSDLYLKRKFYAADLADLVEPPLSISDREQLKQSTRSILCSPIFVRDRLFGAVALHTTQAIRTFSDDEILLLQQIADQAAIALQNAQSYEHLEQLVKERTQELEREKLISEAANRAKTEFLATMSHELRTPLNAVMGLSQILQREVFGSLNPKQAEYLSHIHSSGEHLLLLINDILDLVKVEAGRETLSLAAVAVPELCHHCLMLIQEQATEKGLLLSSQVDANAHTCIADERRLKQMLLNLLSNAVKFTSEGTIALKVDCQADGIRFSITDTGIGIAPENLPLLFQPFFQLDSELDRQYDGTGLGLALTQRLAQLHHGSVTVTSKLGEGSCFTLFLPNCSPEKAPRTQPSATSRDAGTNGRILILEVDRASALLRNYLHSLGYQVQHLAESSDFVEGDLIEVVRRSQPHLILLNAQLPNGKSGLELLQTLRQTIDLNQIPVVVMAATVMAGDRDCFLAAGANDYLSKPLKVVQLESLLLRYVSGRLL
ncbi:MAG TPA: GAF domain-containing protein [Thermosynechococcaceae cyanobacterium]